MSLSDRIEVWLRLRDAARFTRDAYAASRSVESIGNKAGTASRQLATLERAGQRAKSGLRVAGVAAAYLVGGLGLLAGAAGAATAVVGLKFNASMEQLTIGFTHFLGTKKEATDYLQQLYDLAAKTPFEFQQVAQAAQQLFAFGSKPKQTIKQLTLLGDAASALGTGTDGINRMVLALGQMQVAGVVQGDELRQFQEAGINVYKYMIAAGLITQKDIGKIGDMHIDATKAIDAIMTGMQKDFGGMSAAQSRTLIGQLSTMKDYAQATAGALTEPLFSLLKSDVLPRINKQLQTMAKWAAGPKLAGGTQTGMSQAKTNFKSGFAGGRQGQTATASAGLPTKAGVLLGQVWAKVFPMLQKGWAILKRAFTDLLDAFKPAEPFLRNVLIPLFKGFGAGLIGSIVTAWKIFIPVVKALMTILGFLGKIMAPFKPLFFALGFALSFVFGGPILKAIGAVFKFAKILAIPINFVDKLFGGIVLLGGVFFKLRGGIMVGAKAIAFVTRHAGIFNKVLRPILWAVEKFGWFIGPYLIRKLLGIRGPMGIVEGLFHALTLPIRLLVRLIGAMVRALTGLEDKFHVVGKVSGFLGKAGGLLGGGLPRLGFHAEGGLIPAGGVGIVGEAGPEIATAGTRGTNITPLSQGKGGGGGFRDGIHVHSHITVNLDGKPIARNTADQVAEWRARKGQNA